MSDSHKPRTNRRDQIIRRGPLWRRFMNRPDGAEYDGMVSGGAEARFAKSRQKIGDLPGCLLSAPVARCLRPGEGPVKEPIAATQPRQRPPLFMPPARARRDEPYLTHA